MLSDEEEKENLSPGEVPTTVVVDSFGKTFEDAVSNSFWLCHFVVINYTAGLLMCVMHPGCVCVFSFNNSKVISSL